MSKFATRRLVGPGLSDRCSYELNKSGIYLGFIEKRLPDSTDTGLTGIIPYD